MNELDLAFKINDQIITFWQFYVAGILGIVGWVFSREKAWSTQKRYGVGVSALIFIFFNFQALYKTILNLQKIVDQLSNKSYVRPSNINNVVFEAAVARLDQGGLMINLIPHVVIDLIIMYLILVVAKSAPSANN